MSEPPSSANWSAAAALAAGGVLENDSSSALPLGRGIGWRHESSPSRPAGPPDNELLDFCWRAKTPRCAGQQCVRNLLRRMRTT